MPTCCLTEHQSTKQGFGAKPGRKRQLGRHTLRWENNIKIIILKISFGSGWTELM